MQRRWKRFGKISQQIVPLLGNIRLRQIELGGLAHNIMGNALVVMNFVSVIRKILSKLQSSHHARLLIFCQILCSNCVGFFRVQA
jgi:hypothetical protein